MNHSHSLRSRSSVALRIGVTIITAVLICSRSGASHGPLPIPPEGTLHSASINVYGPSGSLLDSVDALTTGTGIVSFLGIGDTYSYTTSFGDSSYNSLQIFHGSTLFDFADGDTSNGVLVPFSLDVGPNQRAYQYFWTNNGQLQVVIGLLDLVHVAGAWSVTSVDTDQTDSAPGTAFLAGPLQGFSVTWNMRISAPLPAGIWLFLSALLPLSFGRWIRTASYAN